MSHPGRAKTKQTGHEMLVLVFLESHILLCEIIDDWNDL